MSFQEQIDNDIKEGRLYFLGDALPPDWYAGLKIWLELAKNGDREAQYNSGRCYQLGLGTNKNMTEAIHWFNAACEQGETRSLYNLASIYEKEEGYINHDKYSEYWALAIKNGEPRALAREKSKKEIEKKNQELIAANTVKKLLEEKKTNEALLIVKEHAKSGVDWATQLLPYFDIEIKILSKGKFESTVTVYPEKDKNFNSYNTSQFTDYLKIEIKNKSNLTLIVRELSDYIGTPNFVFSDYMTYLHPNSTCVGQVFAFNGVEGSDAPCNWLIPIINYKDVQFKISTDLNWKYTKPTLKKNACFVVTVCYGNPDHPTVLNFRRYRDERLCKNYLGRLLIKIYYKLGPKISIYIEKNIFMKKTLRLFFNLLNKVI